MEDQKLKMENTSNEIVSLNISDEACLQFGFLHGQTVIHPNGETKVTIQGVYPGKDGRNKLWYEINHSKTKGKVCYWGGAENLLEAGFRKVI